MAQNSSTPPTDMPPPDDSLIQALIAAKPRIESNIVSPQPRPMPEWNSSIVRRDPLPEFPPDTATEQTVTQGGNDVLFSFLLEADGISDDGLSTDVLIHDGEVNGEVPTGMGSDDFDLSVNFDGAFINLIVTYDTTLLTITSLTFAVESDVADPTLGTFRIEIGRVYLDFDPDTGKITNVTCVNTQCGDINFQLIYGSFAGVPAIIPVAVYAGFVSAALV